MTRLYLPTPGYEHLVPATLGAEFLRFPDGELSITLQPVVGKDVVVVGGCHDAEASETLLALAHEVARGNPATLTVVNTYFRNARSERSVHGEAVMAKFQADLWSGLGLVFPGVKLVFIDLHTDLILNYFHGAVRTENRSRVVHDLLFRAALDGCRDEVVLGTVDEGKASQIRKLAAATGNGFASIAKQRLSGSETRVIEVHGNVDGKRVVIFDDMVSTANSLANAAEAYRSRGAVGVVACAAHGVFAPSAVDRIRRSCVERLYVTDSHPNALSARDSLPERIVIVPLGSVI